MKKLSVLLAFLAGLIFYGNRAVSANDTDSQFDVALVKNDRQRDTNNSWFDLQLNPGESTTLTLKVSNRSKQSATFDVMATQAQTGSNMQMIAEKSIGEAQKTVIPALQQGNNMLTVKNSATTIAAGETKEITATVHMPSKAITGSWLGGIHIQKRVTNGNRASNGYTNRFNYLAYVQLSNTDAVTKASLSLKKVSYQIKNQAGLLNINLQNDQAGYVGNASSKVIVRQKDDNKDVLTYNQNNQSIANGSNFTYQVPTDSLKAGKTYVADITIHDNKNNLTWHFEKEFSVSAVLPVTGWAESSPLTRDYHWLWWLLLLPVLALLIFFWRRNKKMVDIIEMVAGTRITRRVSYKVYKQMVKEGIPVSIAKNRSNQDNAR
ncbi:DUF916 and DUF3324 domain-containing protein [Fructobacillus sp. M1-13]|uniref:DUF916 domain-containing protein n=1 Tax=Fructobacillus papyriferae TaxID=2713171 RepID=A0ABS5QQJ5_9LACO|nr:DUF916 domain-containing protein [Fructobacillus papyriferae]MBS9335464.1 DUF916 domain-containing protein [Fructobacillus papyriferae]MCD2159234.1 DUF916 and DUF3324 domain-containing protein [Fructobacillus papyriferae]